MDRETVFAFSIKHKTYLQIRDIVMNKDGLFKTLQSRDRMAFLGLNALFYLVLNQEIGTVIYNDNVFFKWLFDLFLEKSSHFNDPRFWVRDCIKKQRAEASALMQSMKGLAIGSEDEKSGDSNSENAPVYNSDDDCRLMIEVLRILFNFTLIETKVLKFKLDTFPPDYQRAVVGRAVRILTLPCQWEAQFDMDCRADLVHLIPAPGLINIKIKICNVALYDGDILGMNLVPQSAVPICDLMTFYCMQTRNEKQAEQISAMMMFLKVC